MELTENDGDAMGRPRRAHHRPVRHLVLATHSVTSNNLNCSTHISALLSQGRCITQALGHQSRDVLDRGDAPLLVLLAGSTQIALRRIRTRLPLDGGRLVAMWAVDAIMQQAASSRYQVANSSSSRSRAAA